MQGLLALSRRQRHSTLKYRPTSAPPCRLEVQMQTVINLQFMFSQGPLLHLPLSLISCHLQYVGHDEKKKKKKTKAQCLKFYLNTVQ